MSKKDLYLKSFILWPRLNLFVESSKNCLLLIYSLPVNIFPGNSAQKMQRRLFEDCRVCLEDCLAELLKICLLGATCIFVPPFLKYVLTNVLRKIFNTLCNLLRLTCDYRKGIFCVSSLQYNVVRIPPQFINLFILV